MISPSYGLMPNPASPGTEPGTFDSDRKPNSPIIASRPLLTSAKRPFAFFSDDAFLESLKGSKRLKGTGCLKTGTREMHRRLGQVVAALSAPKVHQQIRSSGIRKLVKARHKPRFTTAHVVCLAVSLQNIRILTCAHNTTAQHITTRKGVGILRAHAKTQRKRSSVNKTT
jgi:hypothetical protein